MATFDENTVYVLDSYGLIFRCYFAFINRPLTNSDGQNVSALFGFFRNLHYILQHYKPGCIVAAMDSKTKTFRHELYDQYKATRNKTPEDLHAQIPWICEILEGLGIPVLQCDGYEADDIIATVAKKCAQSGRTCRILSGDKDLMQLVNDTTQILKPDANSAWKVTGIDGVQAEWGVLPAQLLDLLALYGDTADNIPGVQGVGVKTAAKLLSEYQNLDGIYAHIDEIKGAMQKKLIDGKENAYFSQKLVRLCDEVPCGNIDAALSVQNGALNYQKAADALLAYGVPAVARQYAELAGGIGTTAGTEDAEKAASDNAASTASGAQDSNTSSATASGTPSAGADAHTAATSANGAKPQNGAKKASFLPTVSPEAVKDNAGSYKKITELAELTRLIDAALASKAAAFDCETDSLDTLEAKIVGFSLSIRTGEAAYIPLYTTNIFESDTFISKEDAFLQLRRLFTAQNCTVALHNGKFDIKVLISNGLFSSPDDITCVLFDTMIAGWLLNPERTGKNAYSLETMGETVLGLRGIEYDAVVPKGQTFADIELEKAVPYAAEDADFTFQLMKVLTPALKEAELFDLFTTLEMRIMPLLAKMELTGIHLSSPLLQEYNIELTTGIEDAENAIYKEVGHSFNIASPKQLQTVLFEERKLKPGKKTKTGYSTDTSVLEELAMYDAVPKMILEYRELAKLQSTYVETLPAMTDRQSRIHTTFVQTGTATGRLSSRDPNLQNIPVRSEAGRRIRSAFTAPEGKVLISADYAQIELVVLAHLSADENMCRAFREGTDVHKATAALIFGVAPDAVTAEMRRTAKTINFGVIYGMSAFRLAGDLGISRTQATEFIENYFKTYSRINAFISETVQKAEKTGYVETMFGHRRPILNINSLNKIEKSAAERIAVNTPVQGTAADIVKKAMLSVNDALLQKKNGAQILLQVHDELIFECPDDPAVIEETVALIKERMENAVQLSIPLRVSIETGKNWGEFH